MSGGAPSHALRFRDILPREHGAWVILLLPLVAGLVAAPSLPGLLVALGALGAMLARGAFLVGPRGRRAAEVIASASLGLLTSGALRGGAVCLVSLAGAGLVGLPLLVRSTRELRKLGSECLALMACGTLLPAILGAGGESLETAFRAWLVLVLLLLPSLVHVRQRLVQRRNGQAAGPAVVSLAVPLGATVLAGGLWGLHWLPGLVPLWTLALLLREFHPGPATPRRLGWMEATLSLGHLCVLWVCLGL